MSKNNGLTDIIIERLKLFTDGEDAFAAYTIGGKKICEKITSKNFKRYVRKIARDKKLKVNDTIIKEIIYETESEGVFTGKKCTVYNRVGKNADGEIIINPCYESGDVIIVNSNGWKITEPPTHSKKEMAVTPLFVKTKGMKEMPFPAKGKGDIYTLQNFIRTDDNNKKFVLIVSYIMQCFFSDGPFPLIVIVAESGSGKTFSTTILKTIVDPHAAPTLSVPREPRDMFSTAGVSWILAYDNFSSVSQWLSDLFCRFSTGGATIDRELFTNGEAYIYAAKRPAIVNGINDFFSQSDVLQRSIIFENERITPEERKEESQLLKEFYENLPGIFHDILDLLSEVLKLLPKINVINPTRMADFCRIGEATAQAMGHPEGFFMEAYRENLKQANDITLDANIISPVLKSYISKNNRFDGTPTELLEALTNHNPEQAKNKYWPKTAKVLSGTLKRLSQNFRETGLHIETGRNFDGRWIEIYGENTQNEIPF